jgi:hypothetical protein
MLRIIRGAGCAFAIALLGGCGLSPSPNPAAVLAGNWRIKTTQPGPLDQVDIQANLDADGKITQITATPPFGGTATLGVDNTTTTEVNGNEVTITIPEIGVNAVIKGTLSDDQNTITGNLSHDLNLIHTDFSVTLPGSDITLTRSQ